MWCEGGSSDSIPLLKWYELHIPHGAFVQCSGKSMPLKTPDFYAHSLKKDRLVCSSTSMNLVPMFLRVDYAIIFTNF